jgi:hypothetical protein
LRRTQDISQHANQREGRHGVEIKAQLDLDLDAFVRDLAYWSRR